MIKLTDVTQKIDIVDKIPKFVSQPILNFECLMLNFECFIVQGAFKIKPSKLNIK
ncbi:MAG: Unknown protein, partial [uncultured Aureispira sp.]